MTKEKKLLEDIQKKIEQDLAKIETILKNKEKKEYILQMIGNKENLSLYLQKIQALQKQGCSISEVSALAL